MDNYIHIPLLNPLKFYDVNQEELTAYFTKHFDDFKFSDRIYEWQQTADYCIIYQTSDIIRLQFESTFDPILVSVIDSDGNLVPGFDFPALVGLPNKFISGTFSFEVEISLADLAQGCYYVKVEAGTGDEKKTMLSNCISIYEGQIKNTILVEYSNSESKDDVLFETDIVFQRRFPAYFGKIEPGSNNESYKDQKYNPTILSNVSFRTWPVYWGDEYGMTDDDIDLLNRIWGCDTVKLDNKLFALVDGKFEFTDLDEAYTKRGVKTMVQEGLNRNSKIVQVNTDPNKKLMVGIMVDKKVFGDTSNQGSSNAVPVLKIV